jgi:hypothetical protein
VTSREGRGVVNAKVYRGGGGDSESRHIEAKCLVHIPGALRDKPLDPWTGLDWTRDISRQS